jgi:hypothetical protein
MTEGKQVLLQSVKGKIVPSEGFTFQKAASCSNRKLYEEKGSVYLAVDRNEAAESSASNQYAR